jgi:hypothetical protein
MRSAEKQQVWYARPCLCWQITRAVVRSWQLAVEQDGLALLLKVPAILPMQQWTVDFANSCSMRTFTCTFTRQTQRHGQHTSTQFTYLKVIVKGAA